MDIDEKKILAIAAGAIGASVLVYQLLKKKPRCITISGTATANGKIIGQSTSKEMEIWLDHLETAIELGSLAYQAWQNVKKRSS